MAQAASFNGDEKWVSHVEGVSFTGRVGDQKVTYFISREVLRDHFDIGAGDIKETFLKAFRVNRKVIYKVAQRLVGKGPVSPGGQFVISTYSF